VTVPVRFGVPSQVGHSPHYSLLSYTHPTTEEEILISVGGVDKARGKGLRAVVGVQRRAEGLVGAHQCHKGSQ
jgi:hypothetical protein